MSYLLTRPTTVLVVADEEDDAAAVHDGLEEASCDVVSAGSRQEALAVLDGRADIGCVVVAGPADDASVPALCGAVRKTDADMPVVAYVPADDDVATAVAAVETCRFLPRSASVAELRAAVEDDLETFERRRREAADSSMFETLLEDAETPIYVKDEQGRHLRMADVPFSVDPEEARGKTDLDIWGEDTPSMAQRTYEDDLHVVDAGEPIYDQDERFESDGEEYWSRTTKVPWRDEDGEVLGLVGISRDITEHVQRAEKLEEQRQRINQFTRYVSHDLQTPLQVASGALELARESGDEAAFRKVETSLERMEETIEDLSNLVNRQSTPEVTQTEEKIVDLATARGIVTPRLAEIAEDVWDVVGVESATLETDVPAETTVTVEEEALRPLLENLLKNAVEHGGPEVTVRIGLTGQYGFYVEDDGPGIPPAERDKVLEEGYTTADDGTGTGLRIVADVAEEYGWSVTLTESDDGGARVEFNDCLVVADPLREVAAAMAVRLDDVGPVGDVEVTGNAEYVESLDRWIVEGGGRNIWEHTNAFQFVSGEGSPPVRVQGRIADLEAVEEYTKAGFMIRDDRDEDAPFGYVGETPGHGTELLWREDRGGRTRAKQLEDPPGAHEWYRIEYRDGTVTCSVSGAGSTWRHIAQLDVSLGEVVTMGLVVCSHEEGRTSVAQFEGVEASELDVE